MGYRECLFTGVGCGLDKGLELSRCAKSGEGEAGGALEGNVLQKLELVIADCRKKASSRWAGTDSCYENPDEGSKLYKGCYVHNRYDCSYQKSLS